jgi:hypothetical protein
MQNTRSQANMRTLRNSKMTESVATAQDGILETPALAPDAVPPAVEAGARRWPRGFVNELKFRVLHFTPS